MHASVRKGQTPSQIFVTVDQPIRAPALARPVYHEMNSSGPVATRFYRFFFLYTLACAIVSSASLALSGYSCNCAPSCFDHHPPRLLGDAPLHEARMTVCPSGGERPPAPIAAVSAT